MFDFIFVLCCKDTTKSNNRQIFKEKSYYIVYYLTFINNKIKDYYIITYFLVLFMLLYVISLYYIYTLLYIEEKTKASRSEGRWRTKAKDAADLFARSSPLFCSVCCPRRPHHRQPLTGSHHQQRRGKSGHHARLWVDAIATTSPPIDQQPDGQRCWLSVILPASPLFCSVCCPHRLHHRQPLIRSHHQQRRGKSGHHARLWVDAIATTSPSIDQQPEGQRLVLSVILTASSSSPSSPPSSPPPSGCEGMAESHPGRAILSRSSCQPSPPCRGASA